MRKIAKRSVPARIGFRSPKHWCSVNFDFLGELVLEQGFKEQAPHSAGTGDPRKVVEHFDTVVLF